MIQSGDGGVAATAAAAGGEAAAAAAAAPRGRRQRRPGGHGRSGSGTSPWWTPPLEWAPPLPLPGTPTAPLGGGGCGCHNLGDVWCRPHCPLPAARSRTQRGGCFSAAARASFRHAGCQTWTLHDSGEPTPPSPASPGGGGDFAPPWAAGQDGTEQPGSPRRQQWRIPLDAIQQRGLLQR